MLQRPRALPENAHIAILAASGPSERARIEEGAKAIERRGHRVTLAGNIDHRYRGYLAWFFATWVGDVWAMALVVAIFGIGHAYQGRKGATRATLAGAVMAAIVLATGSLIPAMIIHAMIDASGGTVGYWLFRSTPQTTPELIPT